MVLRTRKREDDEALLALRLFRNRQAEHGVYILAAQSILDGAGSLIEQANLADAWVGCIVDELQLQLLTQWRCEADVFAIEVDAWRARYFTASILRGNGTVRHLGGLV